MTTRPGAAAQTRTPIAPPAPRLTRRRLVGAFAALMVGLFLSELNETVFSTAMPTVVAELHRHVEVVMTWPVNDVATLEAALAVGATGIISDDLDVLAELQVRQRNGSGAP